MIRYVRLESVVLSTVIQMSHVMGKWSKVCPWRTKGNQCQLTWLSLFLIRCSCVIFDGICNRVVNAFFDRNSLLLHNLPVNGKKYACDYNVTINHTQFMLVTMLCNIVQTRKIRFMIEMSPVRLGLFKMLNLILRIPNARSISFRLADCLTV